MPPPPARPARTRLSAWGIPAGLVLAVAAAYAGTFQVPFLLDDPFSIENNPSIRDLGRIGGILRPDVYLLAGRPLLSLSFALNYAWSAKAVWSYHLVNLGIHAAAALLLFGLVRRTLLSERLGPKWREAAAPVAGAAAALWALHPLQTEAVTYLTQRAESLMGLFYFATLYGFARSRTAAGGGRALGLGISALACWAGMATKQVMVTAPAMVLLYDRVFWSGSFRAALARGRAYYPALFASWLFLGALAALSPVHDASVGFHAGVGAWTYLLTEAKAVALYAKLALWPHPLVFDYGGREVLAPGLGAVRPQALLVLAGLALAALAYRRRPPAGFLLVSFFILLAPNSSVVPLALQPIAEHRMYLPLAPLAVLAAVGAYAALGRRGLAALLAGAALLGVLTVRRNAAYGTALGLWSDTVAKAPGNARAQNNLGIELARDPARLPEAIEHYRAALRIRPGYAEAHYDLGAALSKLPGREAEAAEEFGQAIRFGLDQPLVRYDLAFELARLGNELAPLPGRSAEAVARYEAALRLDPGNAEAHNNLAVLLAATPERRGEALAHYQAALRLRPAFPQARANLGLLYARMGRRGEAAEQFELALRLDPGNRQYQEILAELRAPPAR